MDHSSHTRNPLHRRLGGGIVVVAITAAACGGSSDDEAAAPDEPVAPATAPATAAESVDDAPVETAPAETAPAEPAPDEPEPAGEPVATEVTNEAASDNTASEPTTSGGPTVGAIDLADIESLVQLHADAYESGADPLQTAIDLSGFPVDQQPPADGPFFSFDVDVKSNSDGSLKVDWEYAVENASASDFALESGRNIPSGPALDLIEATYVEQWASDGLVFQNGATFSDDSHPSGQGNTQLYFKPESPVDIATPAGSGDLVTVGAAAWGDLDGGDAVDGDAPQPGYSQFISASFDSGVMPVPIIAGLLEAVPATAGMALSTADLNTKLADPEGPFGEFGGRSLFVRVRYEVPAGDFDVVAAHFAANPFDSSVIRYARIDSFAEPIVAIDDTFDPASDFLSVKLLLNDTYPGSLSMSTPDADDETFDVRIEFNLDPLRTPLV